MILKEKKVYVYPEEVSAVRDAGLEVPSYTGTVALMFTSNRGMIPLYDLERGRSGAWRSQFPAVGAKVADAWANVGPRLKRLVIKPRRRMYVFSFTMMPVKNTVGGIRYSLQLPIK